MNENKEKTAGNLANSVVEGYDYSVAVRMSGRAGAYSPTGGKGNAFEVMYSDKKNLSNLLKPDTTTTLTNSSTARQVDLVTKKGNRIIERIQCKDTPSAKGTMDTIKRVQNGQYRTTQLVGTSESAAAFNAKAPSQGVTKVMKDSGISTKDTTRVSNKFNGVQSSTGIANAAKSSAKLGGAFGGGMAAVESIVNGDDLSTTTGPLVDQNGDQAHWNIYIKKYLGDAMGAPSTLIPKEAVSIYNAGTQCVQELFDGKRVFENVKPVNVIQYFINMAAKDGDIVMDFFSGSATTAHAVMQTEADKNIDLHYILVQIPQECDKKSEAYKAGYKTICEIGKERIRRAAEKIKRENGCENRDFGFRVLRLDESNMEDVYYMPEEYTQEMLCGLETNIKPDRTDLDLLFACLTEWGLLLSKPYSSEKIGGYTVHYYDGKELAACFNENISETVIRKIAGQHPRRAVFCDASFSDSAAKINMSELFRTISPETQIKVI